jgi:hypothetical protein
MVMLWLASYDEQRARIYCKEAQTRKERAIERVQEKHLVRRVDVVTVQVRKQESRSR